MLDVARKVRIEQLLLLIVRCLLLLLLIAAMCSVTPWAEAVWRRFATGTANFNGIDIIKYTTKSNFPSDNTVGVSFVTDENCVQHAALVIINFVSQ